jgi:hypothetical protein
MGHHRWAAAYASSGVFVSDYLKESGQFLWVYGYRHSCKYGLLGVVVSMGKFWAFSCCFASLSIIIQDSGLSQYVAPTFLRNEYRKGAMKVSTERRTGYHYHHMKGNRIF